MIAIRDNEGGTMIMFAHRSAPRGWGLSLAVAAALALAAAPATARAQTVEAGHAEVVGTTTGGFSGGCPSFTETATGVGAVDDPVGTYAGTFDITVTDGISMICGGPITSMAIDTGSFSVSVSGSTAGSTIVCRQYGSPPGSDTPMPGLWFRIGEVLILGADGVCSINGVDSVHEQVWQTLVYAPAGPPSLSPVGYGNGVVTGDLRIGN